MPGLQLADASLHYLERGAGPLALFVHGFPLDATLWLDQLEALADVRRCVAIDLRGFGRSEPTRLPVLSMEQHADDLAAAIRALGAPAADVVALSMGGYVALALVERHPGLVRSLALVDTKAAPDSEQARRGRDEAAARLLREGRHALAGAHGARDGHTQHRHGAHHRRCRTGRRYGRIRAAPQLSAGPSARYRLCCAPRVGSDAEA